MEEKCTERVRARFWKRVQKSEDSCWNYISKSNKKSHIFFITSNHSRSEYYATRIAKYISGCDVAGKIVYRTCMTHNCVNPDHLAVGTHRDVIECSMAKGITYGRKYKPIEPKKENLLVVNFD